MIDPRLLEPIRRRVGSSVQMLFQPEGERKVRDLGPNRADPGLFGPTSVAWRVHRDLSTIVGGIRALMVQTLHPLVMAGVAEHSDYREDPWGRLRRTAAFIGDTTFGSTQEAEAAIDRVHQVHRRVRGIAPDGRPYAANDPDLLTWVHTTEIDGFLVAYQRYGRVRLTAADADRYVAEMAVVAELLGAADPPRSVDDIAEYYRMVRPDLRLGSQAVEALRFLLLPPVPLRTRPAYAVIGGASIEALPSWARRMMRIPAVPLAEPLLVRPAAKVLLSTLGWAISAPAPDWADAPSAST